MILIQSIALFTALNLLIIGLSHCLRPKIWVVFFMFLAAKKQVGNVFNALLAVGTGTFICSLHFIWKWPQIIVTLYGLTLVMKGFLFLVFPEMGLASIRKLTMESVNKFRVVGLIMVLLSLIIIYGLMMEGAFTSSTL
ncbi:MAG: hypothetical protein ACPGJS_09120 [Flammeovirgaceae bacterium]